jgi:hypothetical protein
MRRGSMRRFWRKTHGPARAFAAADKYNVADLDERQACTLVGADRTMIRYRSRRSPDTELRARLLPRSPCASGHDYEVSWRWQPAADLGNCERYVEWTWDAEGHDRTGATQKPHRRLATPPIA